MAFIIETPSNGSTPFFEIIEGANHVSLSDAGALLVWDTSNARNVLAIYQPGEWVAARKDGEVRRAVKGSLGEVLSAATLGQESSN